MSSRFFVGDERLLLKLIGRTCGCGLVELEEIGGLGLFLLLIDLVGA